MDTTTISRVRYWWDGRAGDESGWYAMAYDEDGRESDDSQKIWFPVRAENYGPSDGEEFEQALQDAFPAADIEHAG